MTTTPGSPDPHDEDHDSGLPEPGTKDQGGAELGMTDGDGSTFEPEEDPDA